MELSNDWRERTNVKLVDILSDILKEPRPPKMSKPTHGYRIAEKAPEIVTAPGAYFPEKKGRVIPLEPRQAGGPVTPAPTRTLQQMLEKLASYAPFPISGAATQSTAARQRVEGQGENRLETAIGATEPKQLPLIPRQMGGEVDPRLFKETFSVNSGDPTQQGIEAAANTASLRSTPLNVSPPTPSLQSFAPGASPTPTVPSTPLTGQGDSINNPMEQRLNSISRSLSLMIKPPPAFKYKGLQKGFESEQRAAYDKKHKPYQDFMNSLKPAPLFSRAGGGSTSPDPLEGLSEEELKKLYEGIKAEFPAQPLASARVPVEQATLQRGHGNIVDMAPNASGTFEAEGAPVMTRTSKAGETTTPTIPTIPKMESTEYPLAPKALTGSLSDIGKEIIPETGETRYTIGDEQGAMTVPKGFTPGEGNLQSFAAPELEERKKWATPGYREAQIDKRQKESDLERTSRGLPTSKVIDVSPGYEKTYYEAHPEERFMDRVRAANQPLVDAYTKMIEQNQNIIKGNFGDMTMGKRAKREARNAAIANLPHLEQGLAQLMASNAAMSEKVGAPPGMGKTPTLHTDEDKYSMSFYDKPYRKLDESERKVVDTKVAELKPLAEKTPTETSLVIAARERGPDGKLTPAAIEAKGALDDLQKVKGRGTFADIGDIGTTPAGVKNEAALTGVPPGDAAIIKQLSDYKIPLPTGFALRSPFWQSILARTALYDTSFDATQYQVRLRLRNDFASGKAAANIRSLNTAVNHLDTLSKKAKGLENSSVQFWNKVANRGLTETGDPRVVEFNNAATAIEGELANVFKNTGATDQEIKAWRTNINASQSPEQLRGGINTVIELLGGRLGALQSQYETGLGKPKDFRFLSSRSHAILKGLGIDVNEIDPVGAAASEGQRQPEKTSRPRAADFGGNPEGGPEGTTVISKEEWVSRARKDERNNQYSDAELAAEYDKKYGGK